MLIHGCKSSRLLLVFFLLLLFTTTVSSKSRNLEDAEKFALSFFEKNASVQERRDIRVRAVKRKDIVRIAANDTSISTEPYYLFNKGVDGGFVIVSGDDEAIPILGYADSGSIDVEHMPGSMKYWLDKYATEINYLNKLDSVFSTATSLSSIIPTIDTPSLPQLGTIKWGQSDPYNLYCPEVNTEHEKAVAGCVATGMAQVMKYHNWPIKGVGNNQYTTETNGIVISEDFSNTYYDWNNMTDQYTDTSTWIKKEAVAKLVYHCGVAANMDYGKEASGATINDAASAFIDHFGYDAGLDVVNQNYYSMKEWTTMLMNELSNARPVPYCGESNQGVGHFFICDGYNGLGYYHMNWGWEGLGNGYYLLSSLDPNINLIVDGYKNKECMIVGLQKPTGNVQQPSNMLFMDKEMSVSSKYLKRNDNLTVTVNDIYNKSIHVFNGLFGVALYDLNNKFVTILANTNLTLESLNGYNYYNWNTFIPKSIKNGVYKLYAVSKTTEDEVWTPIRQHVGLSRSGYYVNVTTNNIELSVIEGEDHVSTFLYEKVEYSITSPYTCVVSGFNNNNSFEKTPISIPDSVAFGGSVYKVTAIDDNAFYYNTFVSDVVIPNSINRIGNNAFMNCMLSSVKFGNAVEEIGDNAFCGCFNLDEELKLPDSLKIIGNNAFAGCIELKGSLNIPHNVIQIGNNAFESTNISELLLGSTIKEIGDRAFYNCSRLKGGVTIPNSVTRLGAQAFSNCSSLSGLLTISDSLHTIESGTFSSCFNIDSLQIGKNVIFIGSSAFYYCSHLQNITVPNDIPPIISSSTFSGVDYQKCVLKVPTVESYKTANYWNLFKNIKPISITSVPEISSSETNMNNIRVLKNPIDDGILALDGLPENGTTGITLYDMQGNQIIYYKSKASRYCEINLGKTKSGIYIVKIMHNQFNKSKSLLIIIK